MTDFRFGVSLTVPAGRDEWIAKCRRAEELGYDVITVADHLGMGMPAPFPAMMAAAAATERMRVGSYVLDTPFYNPTLLARDVVGVDVFTGGRLEIGLGAGAPFAEKEYVKAGIPFERPGKRIDQLERTIEELARFYADPSEPNPVQQPGPKLLIAGGGKRTLKLAARKADIIAVNAHTVEDLDTKLTELRADLGDRVNEVELNNVVFRLEITNDREAKLRELDGMRMPGGSTLTAAQAAELPSVMVGSPDELAEQLRAQHRRFGFSYFTTMHDDMEDFAKVIALVRG